MMGVRIVLLEGSIGGADLGGLWFPLDRNLSLLGLALLANEAQEPTVDHDSLSWVGEGHPWSCLALQFMINHLVDLFLLLQCEPPLDEGAAPPFMWATHPFEVRHLPQVGARQIIRL